MVAIYLTGLDTSRRARALCVGRCRVESESVIKVTYPAEALYYRPRRQAAEPQSISRESSRIRMNRSKSKPGTVPPPV
jgi:hypothetical protein